MVCSSRVRRTWAGLAGALCAALAGGCSGDSSAPQTEGTVVASPARRAVLGPLSTQITPATSAQSVGPASFGALQYQTLVTIKITGFVQLYYSTWTGHGANAGKYVSEWDAGGQYSNSLGGCAANVSVSFSGSGGFQACDAYNAKPLTSDWVGSALVQGTASVSWARGPYYGITGCDGLGQPPCYTFTGSHNVEVTPVPAKLLVNVDKRSALRGTSFVFTASVSPAVSGSSPVPFQVTKWRFVDQAGLTTDNLCPLQARCSFAPAKSGTMFADGIANGGSASGVHVCKRASLLKW
jgi:hypothetical protein